MLVAVFIFSVQFFCLLNLTSFIVHRVNKLFKVVCCRGEGRQEKNKGLNILNYIKINLDSGNPLTNGTYMPNFIFLHRVGFCTACRQIEITIFDGF